MSDGKDIPNITKPSDTPSIDVRGRRTDTATKAPERVVRDEAWRDDLRSRGLNSRELPQSELKVLAKENLPARLHEIVDKSEVLSITRAEDYNQGFGTQKPAAERGRANVVELRLGAPFECGQAHYDKDGRPAIGAFFSEFTPAGQTPGQVRELFALPREAADKTHASLGFLKPGATVFISEAAAPARLGNAGDAQHGREPIRVPPLADVKPADQHKHLPPMASELPARTYQFELWGERQSRLDHYQPVTGPWKLWDEQVH